MDYALSRARLWALNRKLNGMPFDLNAIERGYGETTVTWKDEEIVLRYRAHIDHRAFLAMKRAAVGVLSLDGVTRFPDIEGIFDELIRLLLPCTPETPEDERGWDIVRADVPVPITVDELMGLPMGLPQAMLIALFTDVNSPNRRRISRRGSSPEVASPPTESPTTTDSSKTLNGQASLRGPSPDSLTLVGSGSAGESGFGV